MLWILLVLAAALLVSGVDLIDKHIITQEVTDPFLATVTMGPITFLMFMAVSLISPGLTTSLGVVLLSLIAGFFSCSALWFYFMTLSKEDVSRSMAFLSIVPLLVLPFGYFFFGEVFHTVTYLGIGLVITGAILLSMKRISGKISFNRSMSLAFVTAVFFASRNILIKFATRNVDIFSVLFWVGLGGLLTSLAFLVFKHPHVKRKASEGVKHLFLMGLLVGVGMSMLFTSISIGPVSLASALFEIKPLFVFLGALAFTLFSPSYLNESTNKKVIIQKAIAILMIVSGALIVIL